MKPPRPGSRKEEVYRVFLAHGEVEALALGVKLELSESTVKSWVKTWARPEAPRDSSGVDPFVKANAEAIHRDAEERFARRYPNGLE